MTWEDWDLPRGSSAASRDMNSENRALEEEKSSYILCCRSCRCSSVAGTWEGASLTGEML